MKKLVILLALSFVFVSFLKAQNKQTKVKKTNSVEYVNPEHAFSLLFDSSPETPIVKPVYNPQVERTSNQADRDQIFTAWRIDPFNPGNIMICCYRPVIIEPYNAIKED